MGLNENAFGIASSLTVFLLDVFGFFWHGMMGQPSMMNALYPGFWMSPMMMLIGLVATVVGAYIVGWLFAAIYNRYEKKR